MAWALFCIHNYMYVASSMCLFVFSRTLQCIGIGVVVSGAAAAVAASAVYVVCLSFVPTHPAMPSIECETKIATHQPQSYTMLRILLVRCVSYAREQSDFHQM